MLACVPVCAWFWNLGQSFEFGSELWSRNLHDSAWLRQGPPVRIHSRTQTHTHTHTHKDTRYLLLTVIIRMGAISQHLSLLRIAGVCERVFVVETLLVNDTALPCNHGASLSAQLHNKDTGSPNCTYRCPDCPRMLVQTVWCYYKCQVDSHLNITSLLGCTTQTNHSLLASMCVCVCVCILVCVRV